LFSKLWLKDEKININLIKQKSVSICIPARNEERNIASLLRNLIQTYGNSEFVKEILVLDDNSTDKTLPIIQSFSEKYNKIQVIQGKELPAGWLGKNWACYQMSQQVKSDYICFIDADVELSSGLLEKSITRVEKYRLALLSLFPSQRMETWGEKLVVPLMHFLLLNLLPLRLVRTSNNPSFAAANGQYMFFDNRVYQQLQFHKHLKNNVLEDINSVKFAKEKGFKTEVLLGNDLIMCRMYVGFKDAVNGFSKNLFAGFGSSLVGAGIYFMLVVVLWLFFFLFREWDIITLLSLFMILINRVVVSYLSGQQILLNILLHPAQMVLYLYIGVKSVIKHYQKTSEWKGRKILN
jgi:chlorobactene glucosyltransferase